ncbi:hypothetical protein KC675_02345 [Candidatus Dojkabacteria bacterium]|uniref:Uncharacterized protein n=1 Tax=Candidatus Dojkabacteria bacterium TaxID=2099670 RepID=A0A955L0E7_9BACT|nr:hypothetical protein [Candidatus Dojkabacteria bacterium]
MSTSTRIGFEGVSSIATTPTDCILEVGHVIRVKSPIKPVIVQLASSVCKKCPLMNVCSVGSLII